MSRNVDISRLKNHWIAPVTRSVSRNPYTEIRKAASVENDIDPREHQGNGRVFSIFTKKQEKGRK